jgi:hypothetical protein
MAAAPARDAMAGEISAGRRGKGSDWIEAAGPQTPAEKPVIRRSSSELASLSRTKGKASSA